MERGFSDSTIVALVAKAIVVVVVDVVASTTLNVSSAESPMHPLLSLLALPRLLLSWNLCSLKWLPLLLILPSFEASSKPEHPLKRKIGETSTVTISEPLLAVATTDVSSSKGKVAKSVVEVSKETSSLFALLNDELQSFSSEEKALISSIMDSITGKSFSKSLPHPPLKDVVRPSYDIRVDGPFIIGHNLVACESFESLLLDGDKKLLSDFPLEALHDMAVHNAANNLILEKENLSYRVKVDLVKMRSKRKDLINLCHKLNSEKISTNKKVALESSLTEVERLKKELPMLQECYDLLKREKKLISSSASIERVFFTSSNATLLQQLEQTLGNSVLEDSISQLQMQVSSL
ncbi:hypothetical protein SLEP1_g18952 [Rubroshorea leprosula]|uniref:Uncharacterized protein n=1 Tax=Rubroshorea leprosula TaxID=152421 RepID=A0AAV5J528_9ROSI|nr:hypothetical protein SLEP1_g18952 [Rubroshorea leprosula]